MFLFRGNYNAMVAGLFFSFWWWFSSVSELYILRLWCRSVLRLWSRSVLRWWFSSLIELMGCYCKSMAISRRIIVVNSRELSGIVSRWW